MTSEKFCLRWNDFESNISVAFREIRDDKDFFDVTLACDDEQIQSHKMILSACSPFFRNILRRNPHQHPLIYLKGVKYTDLQAVLNFMYHGEVNVAQEELNSFLAVAEDLRVKGLTQNQTGSSTDKPESYSQPKASQLQKTNQQLHGQEALPPPKRQRPTPTAPTNTFTTTTSQFTAPSQSVDDDDIQEVVPVKTEPRDPPPPPASSVSQPSQDIYTAPASHSLAQVEDDSFGYQDDQYAEYDQYEDGQEYDGAFGAGDQTSYAAVEATKGYLFEDPKELLQYVRKEPADKRYYCTLCDKFSHTNSHHTRNHVESQHFPNTFSYPCDMCDSVFSTNSNFSMHKSRKHKNKI